MGSRCRRRRPHDVVDADVEAMAGVAGDTEDGGATEGRVVPEPPQRSAALRRRKLLARVWERGAARLVRPTPVPQWSHRGGPLAAGG